MDHTPDSPPAPRPKLIEPATRAIDWTGKVLFRPFDLRKWFTLGFCAWLAWLGQGGGGGASSNWNVSEDDFDPDVDWTAAHDWIQEYLVLVIALSVVIVIVIIGMILLFTWLSSRGKLMFLDGVVHDRGAVVEPWHHFRELGNSLFGFRIVVVLIALVVFGAVAGLTALTLVTVGVGGSDLSGAAIVVIVGWLCVIVALVLLLVLIGVALNDFVVPIMWLRGARVLDAWAEFRDLLYSSPGSFVLYLLLKFVIAITLALAGCLITCVTCCVAALPYIGTVILLPLFVFRRSFSMYFLSQFSPDYAALVMDHDKEPTQAGDGR